MNIIDNSIGAPICSDDRPLLKVINRLSIGFRVINRVFITCRIRAHAHMFTQGISWHSPGGKRA